MTKKVLITGGAGYVGCILTKTLLQHNFKVVVVDCLWFNQITPSIWIHDPNYTFINGDIRDQKTLDKCFKSEIDYVIHAAAVVGDPASKLFPHETKTINFDASQLLLTMSQKNNVKGVVFLSTCFYYPCHFLCQFSCIFLVDSLYIPWAPGPFKGPLALGPGPGPKNTCKNQTCTISENVFSKYLSFSW